MSISDRIDELANSVHRDWETIDSGASVEVLTEMIAIESKHTWEALRMIAKILDERLPG